MSSVFLCKPTIRNIFTLFTTKLNSASLADQYLTKTFKPNRCLCTVAPTISNEFEKEFHDDSDTFGKLTEPLEIPKPDKKTNVRILKYAERFPKNSDNKVPPKKKLADRKSSREPEVTENEQTNVNDTRFLTENLDDNFNRTQRNGFKIKDRPNLQTRNLTKPNLPNSSRPGLDAYVQDDAFRQSPKKDRFFKSQKTGFQVRKDRSSVQTGHAGLSAELPEEDDVRQLSGKDFQPRNNRPKTNTRFEDTFGTLVENDPNYKETLDTDFCGEDEEIDDEVSTKVMLDEKRKRFIDYSHDMRNLARSGRLKEAIDLLDWINKELKWQHESTFLYTMLIGFCGRAGYTEKAFQLFRQLKDHNLDVTPAVLTGLFNACAECPFPDYGLKEAKFLYERVKVKGWKRSTITYHAMIKAFGKCGDLETAFELVDEMIWNKHAVTTETFSFLLMACISDRNAGFTHALLVMRKMRKMRIKTDVYVYDLFLRATRDCGIGPVETASQLLLEWKPDTNSHQREKLLQSKMLLENERSLQMISPGVVEKGQLVEDGRSEISENEERASEVGALNKVNSVDIVPQETMDIVRSKSQFPDDKIDLLSFKPGENGPEVVALSEVKYPSDRLKLVGGLDGMLLKFKQANLKPSIKTFTILLACLPLNRKAEMELVKAMDEHHVKPDIDFFNVMIKKRCSRYDDEGGKKILDLIKQYGLSPDIATFGVLALTCRTRSQSREFLNDMQSCNVKPNVQIFGALLSCAKDTMDLKYFMHILRSMKENEVKPDPKILEKLELVKQNARKIVLDKEHNKPVPEEYDVENYEEDFKKFSFYYGQWLKAVDIELSQHPWKQFQEN